MNDTTPLPLLIVAACIAWAVLALIVAVHRSREQRRTLTCRRCGHQIPRLGTRSQQAHLALDHLDTAHADYMNGHHE